MQTICNALFKMYLCGDTGLLCEDIGLFCGYIGLFCGYIGLCCRRMCMWSRPLLHIYSRYIHKSYIFHIYTVGTAPYIYTNVYMESTTTPYLLHIYTQIIYTPYVYCSHYSIYIHEVYIDIHECILGVWGGYR